MLSGGPPSTRIVKGVSLGGWINFSEFYTMQKPISKSELAFIENLSDSGNGLCVADIGANLGSFSLVFGIHRRNVVHAFEPVPETFTRFLRNVTANKIKGEIIPNCLAVSDRNAIVTIAVQRSSPATNKISGLQNNRHYVEGISYQGIGSVSLDEYAKRNNVVRFDFVKIDVEGYEAAVLRGARSLYVERRIGKTLLEVCPRNLELCGFTLEGLFDEITMCNCDVFRLLPDGSLGEMLGLAELKQIQLENVILQLKPQYRN